MAQDETKIVASELPKLEFAKDQTSPTLEIGVGEYHRNFKATDQPFSVKDEEELRLLLNTGHFVKAQTAKPPTPPPPPPDDKRTGGSGSGTTAQ